MPWYRQCKEKKQKDGPMAKNQYSRLTIDEREILYKGLAEGRYQKDIAKELNCHPSTVSREVRKGGMNRLTYRPNLAEKDAKRESLKRKRKYKLVEDQELAKIIEDKLKLRWSPEQISGVFKVEFPNSPYMHVSHETIYRYIYSIEDKVNREFLVNCLRQSRKRRRPRKKRGGKRTTIRNLISIHKRPEEVENREVPGHWEGDLVIGKDHKSAIGTLVERTTGFTIIVSFQGRHSTKAVCEAFAAALGILPPHMKKSLTYDRGTEMAGHQWFTQITGIPVFFADPYCSWQRGTNENTNGLIRDYLPKKTDFKLITDQKLFEIQNALNHRPRKRLNFCNPNEMFRWFLESPKSNVHDFYATNYGLVM